MFHTFGNSHVDSVHRVLSGRHSNGTSVITQGPLQSRIAPQAQVVVNVVPYTDISNRTRGRDLECVAPFYDDEESYRLFPGEIAFTRDNDIATMGPLPNNVPKIQAFTNMAGILYEDVGKVRPIGIVKNPGMGGGVDRGLDNEAGVVVSHGTETTWNMSEHNIEAGHYVWASPIPASIYNGLERQRAIVSGKMSRNKWLASTHTLRDTNVTVTQDCIAIFTQRMFSYDNQGGSNSLDFDDTTTARAVEQRVTQTLQSELSLEPIMPLWNFAHLRAALDWLDGWADRAQNGSEAALGDDNRVVPNGIVDYLVRSYNNFLDNSNMLASAYTREIGDEPILQSHYKPEQFYNKSYTKLSVMLRSKIEQALAKSQARAHDWLNRMVIGKALTGAVPGQAFDILLGIGHT